ncbi:sporangia induced hypothetical protein [Thraustotheca clavata]|uniref:C2HC/C3H-type domain-containing protein n=1 Tax=Thraustotheca clavata TaxID=74557 RepID=A0A1W0A2Y8_9STRA|nr:sporangia induced hypothetical protein [Thraustotheca clavata]
MQRESKIKYDPTDHAKKQLAAKERAKELRDARQRGVVNDACTFTPKVNPRKPKEEQDNNHEERPLGSPPIRSKFNSTQPPPSPPIKSKFQATQQEASPPPSPPKRQPSNLRKPNNQRSGQQADSSDALDTLSTSYNRPSSKSKAPIPLPELEEPQHDTLSNEMKSRTGKTISRENKPKLANTGECLRNSSCTCRQCNPGAAAPQPLVRQRTMKNTPSNDMSVDQSSLTLLKSKMSRRKSRSAPTNPSSMFVVDDKPRQLVHSARDPPSASPPQVVRKAPPPRVVNEAPPSPVNVFSGVPDGESEVQDDGANHTCPDCQRRFNATAFAKHQKICKKVFSGPKKVFNMAAARLKGTEVEKLLQEKGISLKVATVNATKPVAKEEQPLKAKKEDWKKKSNAFRDAIKSSKEYDLAKKEGRALPPPKPAEIDPSLIQCSHCSRRFNEKAAERHIPYCKEKSERTAMSGGPKKPVAKQNTYKAPPPKQAGKGKK